ncbi:MAG: 16S rRNA (cytosine(1402)-N(4))-methyltransferase RsmH, partial [Eggerthellaceae bacterium]|nr:16S rRNA (cytosine(1402)-N(4))-methyltransferase RsmH [Eggerthellaceae bacterium]
AECLEYLQLKPHYTFVDATLGGAGHSYEIAQHLGADGMLIGIDQDDMALQAASSRLSTLPTDVKPHIELLKGNFGDLDKLLMSARIPGIDAILFDLGVSSPQLDIVDRGFTFKENAPLDMRMDPGTHTTTAAELINTLTAPELARIIASNSDEKWASRIAQFIVAERAYGEITTTGHLVEVIKKAIPASARRAGGHPAKRTFQALRIAVNDELGVLERGLQSALAWLNPGGHIAVISYHSLEDRLVKNIFNEAARDCVCPPDIPICTCNHVSVLEVETKRPILPTSSEIAANPRARSAKLRVARKL